MLETADLAELTVVRSLLDAEGIAYVVVGEEAVRLGPMRALNPLFSSKLPTARLQVAASEAQQVAALLRELVQRYDDEPPDDQR